MSNYIGVAPIPRKDRKYLYKLTRNSNQELILTKLDLGNTRTEIELNDPELNNYENDPVAFQGFDTDYVVINMNEDHSLINPAMGTTEYKVRNDDISYFVNEEGYLIARIYA